MFGGFLSAFLIFTIDQLKPDSTDISKDILLHISLQLSNSSVPPFVEPEFSVSSSVAVVNTLLFTSLALVLVDAFLAMLIKGWLREFDRSRRSSNDPEERARIREIRLQGLERWRLAGLVALLPLLIQSSLILFGVALVIILFNLHPPTAYSFFAGLSFAIYFYFTTIAVSALDPSSPFTSPVSRSLHILIRHFLLRQRAFVRPSDDAEANWHKVKGIETHLAISERLYAATSKAVENLPVFIELLDQWVHTPSLRPHSMSTWHQILPLVQPYLSNASLGKVFGLRSAARLFLCFGSEVFSSGQQVVIAALEKHVGNTGESSSIEQLYIHLLNHQEPDWSLACALVPRLEADNGTVIELRWIINWITYRFLEKSQGFPDECDLSWVSSMRDIIPFLRNTAIFIIQNKMVNDDHGLFNSLLLVTQSIADGSHLSMKGERSQISPWGIHGGMFISIGDFFVLPESQWDFIGGLYTALSTSAPGFKHDFTVLIILIMIAPLSAVEYSDIYARNNYDRFINPERDLPALMDGLWETWKAYAVDFHLLTGIAAWLLKRPSGSCYKPAPDVQRSFQDLLDAYDSHTSGTISLMTSNALLFIEAALLFSLETAKPADEGSKWEPQTLKLKNPWLVMHIDNVLRRDWRIPESAMECAVGDLSMPDLHGLHNVGDPRNLLNLLDPHDHLDLLDRLRLLDLFDRLDHLDWHDLRDLRDLLERLDYRNRLDLLDRIEPPQSSTVLEMIAGRRFDLFNAKVLRPDPLALSLFLSPRNKVIFNDSRRLILEFFRSTPSAPSPVLSDATELEAVDLETARKLCVDFFCSNAVGDLLKWRLLASVLFPEWETLSAQWKDLLAAEVMKVKYRVENGDRHRVDWMARVTPLLEGELDLDEFGLPEDDRQCGSLTSKHLHIVATVVEHLGVEGLEYQIVRELEELLWQYSAILRDERALDRIQIVINQVPDALESLGILFSH